MNKPLQTDDLLRLTREFGLYEWSAQSQISPLTATRAKGVYFWTSDEKRFLDFNSQLMCVNIGHGDERVLAAIHAQLENLAYVTPFVTTEPRAILHKTLAELTPGDLNRSFFTLGGADAN